MSIENEIKKLTAAVEALVEVMGSRPVAEPVAEPEPVAEVPTPEPVAEDDPPPTEKALQGRCLSLVRADRAHGAPIKAEIKRLGGVTLKQLDSDGRAALAEFLTGIEAA